MSNVKVQGHPSGTGNLTIAAPNTNSDYTLNLPAASGTLLTNSGTEAGAFSTLSVNGNNISAQNSLGFRNRIINGDMRIDQRNAGASINVTSAARGYPCDRFGVDVSSTIVLACQSQTSVVPNNFRSALGVTVSTAKTPTATDFGALLQVIEGFNIADVGYGTSAAQPVVFSFWVRSSLTGTFCVAFQHGGNRCYPTTYTINSANTWEYKTVAIPADTTAGSSENTTNGVGLIALFDLGYGSNYNGTANTWSTSTTGVAVSGTTKLAATTGATFYITGVQLEAGSVATPFERRPYGTELMLCQRYYWRIAGISTALGFPAVGAGTVRTSTLARVYTKFPTSMRAAPSLNYGGTLTVQAAETERSVTSIQAGFTANDSALVDFTFSSGPTAGQGAVVFVVNNPANYFDASAEL